MDPVEQYALELRNHITPIQTASREPYTHAKSSKLSEYPRWIQRIVGRDGAYETNPSNKAPSTLQSLLPVEVPETYKTSYRT